MKIRKILDINRDIDSIIEVNQLDEDYLMEMAVLDKNDSGLPYDLWLDPAARGRNTTHSSPRLKINVDNRLIPFLIDKENPDVPDSVKKVIGKNYFRGFNYVKKYIQEYYDILIDYWNGKLTDKQALNSLGRLGERNV